MGHGQTRHRSGESCTGDQYQLRINYDRGPPGPTQDVPRTFHGSSFRTSNFGSSRGDRCSHDEHHEHVHAVRPPPSESARPCACAQAHTWLTRVACDCRLARVLDRACHGKSGPVLTHAVVTRTHTSHSHACKCRQVDARACARTHARTHTSHSHACRCMQVNARARARTRPRPQVTATHTVACMTTHVRERARASTCLHYMRATRTSTHTTRTRHTQATHKPRPRNAHVTHTSRTCLQASHAHDMHKPRT